MKFFVFLAIVFFESIIGAAAVWFHGKHHDGSTNN